MQLPGYAVKCVNGDTNLVSIIQFSNKKQKTRSLRSKRSSSKSNRGFVGNPRMDATEINGQELKIWSGSLTSAFAFGSISTTPVVQSLTAPIVGGSGLDQRAGFTIKVKSVGYYGCIAGGQSNTAPDDSENTIRIAILEGNVAAIVANAAGSFSVGSILDPRKFGGVTKVLADHTFVLHTQGKDTTGYLPALRQLSLKIPLNKTINFTGTGANKDLVTSLVMIAVTDSSVNPNPGFLSGTQFCEFTDS